MEVIEKTTNNESCLNYILEFISTMSKFMLKSLNLSFESIKNKLINEEFGQKIAKFINDQSLNILLIQIYTKTLKKEENVSYDTFDLECSSFFDASRINPHNILLVVLIKNSAIKLTVDNFQTAVQLHNYCGILKENMYSMIWNSFKPVMDNYIKNEKKNKLIFSQFMRSYSEFDRSLLEYKEKASVHKVVLDIPPDLKSLFPNDTKDISEEEKQKASELSKNIELLTKLYSYVAKWCNDYNEALKIENDPFLFDSYLSETTFWENKMDVFDDIKKQSSAKPILLTFEILNNGNRRDVVAQWTKLLSSNFTIEISNCNRFIQELNLPSLFDASTLDAFVEKMKTFTKSFINFKFFGYPCKRLLCLSAILARDINRRIIYLVSNSNAILFEGSSLHTNVYNITEIYKLWIAAVLVVTSSLKKDLSDCSAAEFNKIYERYNDFLKNSLEATYSRVALIAELFDKHQQINYSTDSFRQWILERAAKQNDGGEKAMLNNLQDIKHGWTSFTSKLNFLDFTTDGKSQWEHITSLFKDQINSINISFINMIHEYLIKASSDEEQIDIFVQFKTVLQNAPEIPKFKEIQNALAKKLHQSIIKMKNELTDSKNNPLAKELKVQFNLSPDKIFLFQKKRAVTKLRQYLFYLTCILGPNFTCFDISQQILADSVELLGKQTQRESESPTLELATSIELKYKSIFYYESTPGGLGTNGTPLSNEKLVVNYPIRLEQSAFDFFYSKCLEYKSKGSSYHSVLGVERYLSYKNLFESLRSFEMCKNSLRSVENANYLLAPYWDLINALILRGLCYYWESSQVHTYSNKFNLAISNFSGKVSTIMFSYKDIDDNVKLLRTCEYNYEVIQNILKTICGNLNLIHNSSVFNLEIFINSIENKIKSVLLNRLTGAIALFTKIVRLVPYDQRTNDDKEFDFSCFHDISFKDTLKPKSLALEIKITVDGLSVSPHLFKLRSHLYTQIQNLILVILNQKRPIFYENYIVPDEEIIAERTFHALIDDPDAINNSVAKAYEAIEGLYNDVAIAINYWLSFKTLLTDPSMENLVKMNIVTEWVNAISKLEPPKRFLTNNYLSRVYPLVQVKYGTVKSQLTKKYNIWETFIVKEFTLNYNGLIGKLLSEIQQEREIIIKYDIPNESVANLISILMRFEELSRLKEKWNEQKNAFLASGSLLEALKVKLPDEFISAKDLELEWDKFFQIYTKTNETIHQQNAAIQIKVNNETGLFIKDANEAIQTWHVAKNTLEGLNSAFAVNVLADYSKTLNEHKTNLTNLVNAKTLLKIQLSNDFALSKAIENLINAIDELNSLTNVWSNVSNILRKIDLLGKKTWISINTDSLNKETKDLMKEVEGFESWLHQYKCVKELKTKLELLNKMNVSIGNMKSSCFKERHWDELLGKFKHSHLKSAPITISQLWELDFVNKQALFQEVWTSAVGEQGLEDFLDSVNDCWTSTSFNIAKFNNKSVVVDNWSDIFTKLLDHLNSLASMKTSPYFQFYKDKTLEWENKLTSLLNLCEVWIELQRKWIYLNGIFSSSSDISLRLPMATTQFKKTNEIYMAFIIKVKANPNTLDALKIPDISPSFKAGLENFSKIEKELGSYLETERESFPRFYFIGDDDLLEILGNNNNIIVAQKYLKKMFPGVSNLVFSEDSKKIIGIKSRETEELKLYTLIDLEKNKSAIAWLKELDLNVKMTLALLLRDSLDEIKAKFTTSIAVDSAQYSEWICKYPQQIILLSEQIWWCQNVEENLNTSDCDDIAKTKKLEDKTLAIILHKLKILPQLIQNNIDPVISKRMINLITTLVYFRDKTRALIRKKVTTVQDFEWLGTMRCLYVPNKTTEDLLKSCLVKMADSEFLYGFEYLGAIDYIIQTPLIENCYLVMMQALKMRLGGSPFGPAGTGKTESVKALGAQLGKFVIVFNCDDKFDFKAMGRIFIGLCRVGAWGCFDEFNRLEERIISAVSQQIQSIQIALKDSAINDNRPQLVELLGLKVPISSNVAIFITMNPDYAGRSKLPNNLKRLFRSFAMTQPDRQLIAQVILYSQGFIYAEAISSKIVPMLMLCSEQFSVQNHYDFGLRSLKNILVTAGNIKRRAEKTTKDSLPDCYAEEQNIIVQSVKKAILPKLISDDRVLLLNIIEDLFPKIVTEGIISQGLMDEVRKCCNEQFLQCGITPDSGSLWLEKMIQLHEIIEVNHGIMLVGPSCSGKSKCWKILLKAMSKVDHIAGYSHIIDPKAISKEVLYGFLDINTREWTDGVITAIIRKILENANNELNERHWIIMDGDVDPEWIENLNSTLDDNKLLTLPNGERLALPPNVRIIFEVTDLRYATPATVSRCGIIYFTDETVTISMYLYHCLSILESFDLETKTENNPFSRAMIYDEDYKKDSPTTKVSLTNSIKTHLIAALKPHFTKSDGIVISALTFCKTKISHCMDFNLVRSIQTLFTLLSKAIRSIIVHILNSQIPLSEAQLSDYILKSLLYSLIWSLVGDSNISDREKFSQFILDFKIIDPPDNIIYGKLHEYYVTLEGNWKSWSSMLTHIAIKSSVFCSAYFSVSTIDTARNTSIISDIIQENRSVILCGPPGSGKMMSLYSLLPIIDSYELITLNFSSSTTPELLLQILLFHCKCVRGVHGYSLSPKNDKFLIFYCDEINLPQQDKYGTQRVISFMRQLIECNGFYRPSDRAWIKLEKISFVGACNPPSDVGRKSLVNRFMRHTTLIYVDYPNQTSLLDIYEAINRFIFSAYADCELLVKSITSIMVSLYIEIQKEFTPDKCRHYIFTPRDLTRWARGLFTLIGDREKLSLTEIVKMLIYEGLRLFQDRLITTSERSLIESKFKEAIMKNTLNIEIESFDIFFSVWTSQKYSMATNKNLTVYLKDKLKLYCDANTINLVFFNQLLQLSLCIDRVFKQVQGHLLLIGKSGSGRKTMVNFVAFLNGVETRRIHIHKNYKAIDFDKELQIVLKSAGCDNKPVALILDEACIQDPLFLERINSLLYNGDVPSLFQGADYEKMMSELNAAIPPEYKEKNAHDKYSWFVSNVLKNLHLIFCMEDNLDDWSNKVAAYPALFNRCVIKWCGNWSNESLCEVALSLTSTLVLSDPEDNRDTTNNEYYEILSAVDPYISAIVKSIVAFHLSFTELRKTSSSSHLPSPKKYLDFIKQFLEVLEKKEKNLKDDQKHIKTGLNKIHQTVDEVAKLKDELEKKTKEIAKKQAQALKKQNLLTEEGEKAKIKKDQSSAMHNKLEKDTETMLSSQNEIDTQLAEVEPMLKRAKEEVGKLKADELSQLKGYPNPSKYIKRCLTTVCNIFDKSISEWPDVRRFLNSNFLDLMNKFQTSIITEEVSKRIDNAFKEEPGFTYKSVNSASECCGHLFEWLDAQHKCAKIIREVEPLKKESENLKKALEESSKILTSLDLEINTLNNAISDYDKDYKILIEEISARTLDSSVIQNKVEKSETILSNLKKEQDRWSITNEKFSETSKKLTGNCLLCAAFLVYSGNLDQLSRDFMWKSWCKILDEMNIGYDIDLMKVEYLSTPEDTISWTNNKLPSDYLCMENAIILGLNKNFPLVIDPSGQAEIYLNNMNSKKNPVTTSFVSTSFQKDLANAIAFGSMLFIHDVEFYDPIVNSILDYNYQESSGEKKIPVAGKEITLSPRFSLCLLTKDPNIFISDELSAKINIVNFTVTFSGLESQCLYQILKSENPTVEKKRVALATLKGECSMKLYNLEKKLLKALNETTGQILENNTVLIALEELKKEDKETKKKLEESKNDLDEVNTSLNNYKPLATKCSMVYFTLLDLRNINPLYQYNIDFFFEIFNSLLLLPKDGANIVPTDRVDIMMKKLFLIVTERVIYGLLKKDKILLLLLLAKIYVKTNDSNSGILIKSIDHLADSRANILPNDKIIEFSDYSQEIQIEINRLLVLPQFSPNVKNFQEMSMEIKAWASSTKIGMDCPVVWDNTGKENDTIFTTINSMLLCHAISPNDTHILLEKLIQAVFGDELFAFYYKQLDFHKVACQEVHSLRPILLFSVSGYDASSWIEDLIERTNKKGVSVVAMGSPEGCVLADKVIQECLASGNWLILKNVHLVTYWIKDLENKLKTPHPNQDFRLFLTAETNSNMPKNVIRMSRVLVFEPPPGVKASLLRSFNLLPESRFDKQPVERARLYFILAWLHALVTERLRYSSLGWTKGYDFSEADLRVSCDMIESWIDRVAGNRSNLPLPQLPLGAIKSLLSTSIYGSYIENSFDKKIMDSFINNLFDTNSYSADKKLVSYSKSTEKTIFVPSCAKQTEYLDWINQLSNQQSPEWLKLPNNAETLLNIANMNEFITNFLKVKELNFSSEPQLNNTGLTEMSKQLSVSFKFAEIWIASLQKLLPSTSTLTNIDNNPVIRFYSRELNFANKLLSLITADLNSIISYHAGKLKNNNRLNDLIDNISKGLVSEYWRLYHVPNSVTLSGWIQDFKSRIEQTSEIVNKLSNSTPEIINNLSNQVIKSIQGVPVHVGKFFFPEAYVTAVLQYTVRQTMFSLEKFILKVCVDGVDNLETNQNSTFKLSGLKIFGAQYENNALKFSSSILTDLPTMKLEWVYAGENETAKNDDLKIVSLPVYLDFTRKVLMFTIDFPIDNNENITFNDFYEHGVAIIANHYES